MKSLLFTLIFPLAFYELSAQSIVFDKTYGNGSYCYLHSIGIDADGNYVATGYDNNTVLLKTDKNGNELWQKSYSGMFEGSCVQILDDGYVIAGNQYTDSPRVVILKTDKNGDSLWSVQYPGWISRPNAAIAQCHDGGFILGIADQPTGYDPKMKLLKLDLQGNKEWEREYVGQGEAAGNAVCQLKDRGFVVAGFTYPDSMGNFNQDSYIVRTDSAGNFMWERIITEGGYQEPRGIIESSNSKIVLVADNGACFSHIELTQLDTLGSILWSRNDLGLMQNTYANNVRALVKDVDQGFLVCGSSNIAGYSDHGFDILIFKTDSLGNQQWQGNVGFGDMGYDEAFSIAVSASDSAILTAGMEGPSSETKMSIVKWKSINTGISEPTYLKKEITFSPNPATDFLLMQFPEELLGSGFSLLNSLGEAVLDFRAVEPICELNVSMLPQGFYMLLCKEDVSVKSHLIVVMR